MHPKPLPILIAVLILIIAGVALWFVLSRPTPTNPIPGGTTATSTPATPVHIIENGQYHEIDATYPSATPLRESAGAQADATAVATMRVFAEQEVARFKDNSGVLTLTQADIQMFGLGTDRKYAFGMTYEIKTSPSTVSYVYLMYADTLGAHPNAYYRTFTFDAKTGESIAIEDLFTGDFLDTLSSESRAVLVPQIALASNIPQSELDRSMLDSGTTPFMDNFQNFYLEADALVLVFPPYQVGPWALGMQEARIPKAKLSSILKAEYR